MIDKNKKYRTRCGTQARVYATDAGGDYPVHGAILREGKWFPTQWTIEGTLLASRENIYDLVEVKPRIKRTFWANVYPDEDFVSLYATKTKADDSQCSDGSRVACVKIEIDCEEGEGL